MKRNIFLSLFVATMLLFSSCDDYLDINFDPSNPQLAEGFALLPPMLSEMVRGEAFDIRYVGQYIQNWNWIAANNIWDQHGYVAGSDAAGEKWRQHYWAIGKNVDLIVEESTKKGQWDYVGAAKAIRAWSWQSSTDVYGEMILSQVFEPNRYVFDYDSQEDIYKEVERLSLEAIKDLERTDGAVSQASLGRGDLVYKGDRSKWIKFTYAVLARNAHHLSNKSNYNPDKVIEYCDKALASNADNFNVPHAGTSTSDGNFFGPTRNNLRSYRQSAYILSLLDGTTFNGVQDPRLSKMLSPSPDGEYRGVLPVVGDPTNTTNNPARIPLLWGVAPTVTVATQIPGKYIFLDKAVHPLITYSEVQFIKAEAAFKKGDRATAFDAFKKGITAHMDFATVNAADRDAYLASDAVPQSADALTLSDIMLQKYISLWVHGALETWVDMRRYRYSSEVYKGFTLPTLLSVTNNGKPAYRLRPRYNSEFVWNLDALNKIGATEDNFHTIEPWFIK
jgi:hypothetical protein